MNINKNQIFLVFANVLLTFFFIVLFNRGIFPLRIGDFVFFALLTLALALYRPGWIFLFFVGSIILENINLAPLELGITVRPYQFFGVIAILALVIRFLTKRLNFRLISLAWPDYLVMLMAGASFLSVLGSNVKGVSLKQSIVLASFASLYFLTRNFLQNRVDIKKIIPFFLSSAIVVMAYGIWQNVRFAQGMQSFEVMPGRPNGTFSEADWLGTYLVMLLAVIYALIYWIRNNNQETNTKQISNLQFSINQFIIFQTFLYLSLVATYTLLIMTVSRSAWLGAVGVTFVFLFSVWTQLKIQPKNWQWKEVIKLKLAIISALLVSIALVYFFNLTTFQLGNRIQSTGTGLQKITISCPSEAGVVVPETVASEDSYTRYGCRHINLEEIDVEKSKNNSVYEIYRKDPNFSLRSEIYVKSWEIIKAHPILGIGWGNIGAYLGQDARGAQLNASNIFLEVWLGSGIVGIVAFLGLLLIVLAQALHNFMQADFEIKTIGLFGLLGFFSILIPNLFNAGIMLGFLWFFLGLSLIKK